MTDIAESQHNPHTQLKQRPQRPAATPDPGPDRDETGAVSAEYAVVTAAGVGIGGILIKLLTSDFGQQLIKMLIDFFLGSIGVA